MRLGPVLQVVLDLSANFRHLGIALVSPDETDPQPQTEPFQRTRETIDDVDVGFASIGSTFTLIAGVAQRSRYPVTEVYFQPYLVGVAGCAVFHSLYH